MERKQDGINLVRVIALLMVFGFHFFLYNGYYHQSQTGISMLLANCSRALFLSCNGIFMVITGYLKSDKPINKHYFRCIFSVIVSYIIAASISIPIRHFYLNVECSFSEWVNRFFSFTGVYYGWYIKMYIGLILISPIINIAVKNIKNPNTLLLITLGVVATTSFSSATPLPIYPSYWEVAYPISYYLIGATIKKYQPSIKKIILMTLILLISFGTGLATLLSTDGKLEDAIKWEFGSIWIMLIGTSMFLLLYKVKLPVKVSKIVCFLASGTFPAYLLSNLMDAWIYKLIPTWNDPSKYVIAFLCLTIPTYLLLMILGNLFQKISNIVEKSIAALYEKIIHWFFNKFIQLQ